MDQNESVATWKSADQLACVQADRKEGNEPLVGSAQWEQIYLMKYIPETGRIYSHSEGEVRTIIFAAVFQMTGEKRLVAASKES